MPDVNERGIPYPIDSMDDLFSSVFVLLPENDGIKLRALKEKGNYNPADSEFELDPNTFLLLKKCSLHGTWGSMKGNILPRLMDYGFPFLCLLFVASEVSRSSMEDDLVASLTRRVKEEVIENYLLERRLIELQIERLNMQAEETRRLAWTVGRAACAAFFSHDSFGHAKPARGNPWSGRRTPGWPARM